MGFENETFSFFPFGALYCLTLFCLVAVHIYSIRYRYRNYRYVNHLKNLVENGELSQTEYQKLKNLLLK